MRSACRWALSASMFFVVRDAQILLVAEIQDGALGQHPCHALRHSRFELPQAKLGIYMGLFNIFIVVPQLPVTTVMGFGGFVSRQPIWTMLLRRRWRLRRSRHCGWARRFEVRSKRAAMRIRHDRQGAALIQ